MKPRSVISLIIAAVLVLIGIITCAVGSAMASSDGVMLFPEADEDGELVYRMELDGISRISVDSDNADVTVIGNAERSEIEVVNFNANYYKLTVSNGSLSFSQIDDFMSMFKFWDNGFSFKGMRYILRFGDDSAGDKRVIIRLSPEDSIKFLSLSSESGALCVEDCGFDADYTLKSSTGDITLRNITDSASLSIYGKKHSLHAENCETEKLGISSDEPTAEMTGIRAQSAAISMVGGSLTLSDSEAATLNVTSESGNIRISPYTCSEGSVASDSGTLELELTDTSSVSLGTSTVNGKISVNGTFVEKYSLFSEAPPYRLTLTTSSGDIRILHP